MSQVSWRMNAQATRIDQPDGGDSATQLGHVVTGELDLSHGVASTSKTSPSASTASRR
jgi:hypothetical protein